jgi:hypothetical protein
MSKSTRVCSVENCERHMTDKDARGLCTLHYARWRSRGHTNTQFNDFSETAEARIMAGIEVQIGQACWIWRGKENSRYGRISFGGKIHKSHRLSYETFVGPIPAGLVLDHLCRNEMCVNPEHLEPVTEKVNILRGQGVAAKNSRKTQCKNDHEFTEANTLMNNGRRVCRECKRKYESERRTRIRESLSR